MEESLNWSDNYDTKQVKNRQFDSKYNLKSGLNWHRKYLR